MQGISTLRAPVMVGKSGTYSQEAIWADCPWDDIGRGIDGSKWELDPHNFPDYTAVSNPTIAAGSAINPLLPGAVYYDTGNNIRKAADEPYGAVSFISDTSDNDEQWFQTGGNAGGSILLNKRTNTNGCPFVAMDACFKTNSVVDDVTSLFIGVGEEGMAVANTKVDDTGVMADKDFLGFGTVHTNGGTTGTNAKLAVIYKKNGQTQQTVIAVLATLVADTVYRVGFTRFPSVHPDTRGITFWYNNSRQKVGVTETALAAATFPDGEEMAPLIGRKNGTTTAGTLKVYRYRIAMWKP